MVGPNDVLTSAQLLFDARKGGQADVTVYPNYNDGNTPFGGLHGDWLGYYQIPHDANGNITRFNSQYDVGIIGLSKPVGNQTGWFGIETHPLTGVNSQPESLTLTGYPADLPGAHGPRIMNELIGVNAAGNNGGNWTLDFGAAFKIHPGDLGAPLWASGHGLIHNGNNGPYIDGVDSTTGWAADLTLTFNQVQSWIKADDYLWGA
jgi:hypothetical protein